MVTNMVRASRSVVYLQQCKSITVGAAKALRYICLGRSILGRVRCVVGAGLQGGTLVMYLGTDLGGYLGCALYCIG